MVFSGRPSTACNACRQRRLKCDRIHPQCTQCLRKGLQCPGYRDPNVLRLRDETSRVARKAERGANQPARTSPSPSPSSPLLRVVTPAAGEMAMGFFVTSYIGGTPFEDYLPSLLGSGVIVDDAFSAATSAAALAAFARHARSPGQMEVARQKYSAALTKVNVLLQRPQTAVLDRTLAAVLLLGLFEAIVFPGGRSPASWTVHTYGAMDLLMLRGKKQFESEISRQLFSQACNNVKTSCIQSGAPIPPPFLAFNREVEQLLDPTDLVVRLAPIINKVAHLKARSMASPGDDVVNEALQVDLEITLYAQSLATAIPYTVRSRETTPSWAFGNVAHKYPSLRAAKAWNAIRLLRMFLLHCIAESFISGEQLAIALQEEAEGNPDALSEPQKYAAACMKEVAVAVFASIPTFLVGDGMEKRFAATARSVAWPLHIIESTLLCTPEMRKYGLDNLQQLASDLNMPQAVHEHRHAGSECDWFHLFHLG